MRPLRYLALLAVLFPTSLLAATRFVTTSGTDSGDCTVNPCATPTYAMSQATAGDTIDVGPGTFSNGGNSIFVTQTLTLTGAQAGVDARLRTANETVLSVPVILSADNVVLDGFQLSCGCFVALNTLSVFSGHQIRNNIITASARGIQPGGNGTVQTVIERNWFYSLNDAVVEPGLAARNVLIEHNLFSGNFAGVVLSANSSSPNSTITISSNQFVLDFVNARAMRFSNTRGLVVSGNAITGNGEAFQSGITFFDGNQDVQIVGNSITGIRDYAFRIEGNAFQQPNLRFLISGNDISGNGTGIDVRHGTTAPLEVHFNRIEDNVIDLFVGPSGASSVNGQNNWWGCNEGPSVCATSSIFSHPEIVVDLDPWLVMDIAADPTSITMLETSSVTSDLNQSSDGAAVSGFVPATVNFSATNGTMNPPSDTMTVADVATSTFDPSAAGTATISATLDDETVSTQVVVAQATTAVALSSTPNPSQAGQPVTFTATVDPAATGTITFFDGATPLGTVPVSNGAAQFSTASLAPGTHTITARYSGDANFEPATSDPLEQLVSAPIPALSDALLALLAMAIAAAAWMALRR